MASALMQVFNMDLAYFETYAPVTGTIVNIVMASGWALLIGNMAFQAMRSMASGLGFEGEDPKILFARTFVFSFLLVASRQICNIGLTLTGTVMDLVGIPDAITITTPEESHLGAFDSSWLLVIIIGLILIFQVIKFFFEIAERYVVIAVLTIMADVYKRQAPMQITCRIPMMSISLPLGTAATRRRRMGLLLTISRKRLYSKRSLSLRPVLILPKVLPSLPKKQ